MAKSSGEPGKGADAAGLLVALLLILILGPLYWKNIRPHVNRLVIKTAVVESSALLHLKPVLPERYQKTLQAIRYRGTLMLCDGVVIPEKFRAKNPPDLVVDGEPYKCRTGSVGKFKTMPLPQALGTLNYPSKVMILPSLLIALSMVMSLHRTNIRERYRRKFDLESFIREMAKENPVIRPIVNERIDEEPHDQGPWRITEGYIEFAITHRLLRYSDGKPVQSKESPYRALFFASAAARDVFHEQLGGRHTTIDDLDRYQLAAFGMCSALLARNWKELRPALVEAQSSFRHLNGWEIFWGEIRALFFEVRDFAQADLKKGSKAQDVLMRTARRFAPKSAQRFTLPSISRLVHNVRNRKTPAKMMPRVYVVKLRKLEKLARKHAEDSVVKEIVRKHAFVHPLLNAMLDAGRLRAGVLESSQFIWLKPLHRSLFYALHNAGMKAAYPEASGVFNARRYEEATRFSQPNPRIQECVDELINELIGESWLVARYRDWTDDAAAVAPANLLTGKAA